MSFRPATSGAVVDNKYRLAERIGGGGMGDVFRAETLSGGRAVAIKLLHAELAQNREVAQRFFQEAQAVNRIRHPNVVEVLDAGVGDFGPYIVMEYLDGESVGAMLNRVARFDADAAIATAIPVLEALDAAHRVGIVHRDLKPENVFVAHETAKSGVIVRLLDFGIAKVLDAEGPGGPRTRTGVVFGTPDYLSPEQATGEGPLDGRSDLFAVGVLIYELVTGMRPFRAPTAVATAFKVVHAEAPSIAGAGVHVDKRLEAVVHRLLQKEPARRFPAAPEVIRELEKLCPDPARRANALLRLLGPRRIPTPTTLDARNPASAQDRDLGATKRITPDLADQATQPSRTVPSWVEASKTPRASGPGMRPPDSGRAGPDTPPRTPRNPMPSTHDGQTPTLRTPSTPRMDSAPGSQPHVRPFPARHVGRFQVRGPVLRAVDRAIVDLYGPVARDELVGRLPERCAAEFLHGAINALVAYELEALDAYMEYASATLVRDPGRWREIGRLSVDGELQTVVRTLLRPANDAASVLRRGVSTWARLFSFGTWRVGTSTNLKTALTVGELEAVSQPLRLWLVGMIEQIVRRAVREDLRLVIASGDQEFAPEMVCEIG
jgi:serine/threonine-protein kinase